MSKLYPCLDKLGNKLTNEEKSEIKSLWRNTDKKGLTLDQIKASQAKLIQGILNDTQIQRDDVVKVLSKSFEAQQNKTPAKEEKSGIFEDIRGKRYYGKTHELAIRAAHQELAPEKKFFDFVDEIVTEEKEAKNKKKLEEIAAKNKPKVKYDYETKLDGESFVRKNKNWFRITNLGTEQVMKLSLIKELQKEEASQKPKEAPQEAKAPESKGKPETKQSSVKFYDVAPDQIGVDTKIFQGRFEAFNKDTYNSIIENVKEGTFKLANIPPIMVFKDNNGSLWTLNHSRLKAYQDLKKQGNEQFETIPVQEVDVKDIEAAGDLAKEKTNIGKAEAPIARAALYINMRKKGKSEAYIKKQIKLNEGKNSVFVENLSYLDQEGAAATTLRQAELDRDANKIADWIGQARKYYSDLTDDHEAEIYTWLTKDNIDAKNNWIVNNKVAFLDRIDKLVNNVSFDKNKRLNIKNTIGKSNLEKDFDAEVAKLESELSDAKKELDAKRTHFIKNNKSGDELRQLLQKYTDLVNVITKELTNKKAQKNDILDQEKNQTNMFASLEEEFTDEEIETIANIDNAEKLDEFTKNIESKEKSKESLTDEEIKKELDSDPNNIVKEEEALFAGRSKLQQLQDEKRTLQFALEELDNPKDVPQSKRDKYPPKFQRDIDNTGRRAQIKAEIVRVSKAIRREQSKEDVKKLAGQTDLFGEEFEGPEQKNLFEPGVEYNKLPIKVRKVFEDQISFDFTENNSQVYVSKKNNSIRFNSEVMAEPAINKSKRIKGRPSYRPLKPGEFSKVERKYRAFNTLQFFQHKEKIESPEDVAFIFRELEHEAVENAFVLHIPKSGKPIVQHLSTGNFNSTFVDPKFILDAVDRFNTKELYFIHNHPSGALEASSDDMRMLNLMRNSLPKGTYMHDGIIINERTNKFGTFGEEIRGQSGDIPKGQKKKKLKAVSFSRLVYDNVELGKKVKSPADAALFVTGSRFNAGKKFTVLVLSQSNQVTGKFHITDFSSNAEIADEIGVLAMRSGGVNVILSGNRTGTSSELQRDIKEIRNQLSLKQIQMLDYVGVHPSPANTAKAWESAVENRILEPKVTYEAGSPEAQAAAKKSLMLSVMKEFAQGYPVNSPQLGEYANSKLPTIEVLGRLKELGLLETVKEFERDLNRFKSSDPLVAGMDLERMARITLREAESPGTGKVSEPNKEFTARPARLNIGIDNYLKLSKKLGQGADLYPAWVKEMVADFGFDVRKGIRALWKQVKIEAPKKQAELFQEKTLPEEIPAAPEPTPEPIEEGLFPKNENEQVVEAAAEIASTNAKLDPKKINEESNKFRKQQKREVRSKIADMIFHRRANIDVNNFKTLLFVHGIKKSKINGVKITPEQLEVIPFLIEETKIPKKLNRPDLEAIYNDSAQKRELLKIADKVQGHFDMMWDRIVENTDLMSVDQVENYVTHIWDIPQNKLAGVTNWFMTRNKFLNKRYISTLEAGIEEFGLTPKTLDVTKIIKIHDATANTVIENNKFVKDLKFITRNGDPLILPPWEAPADWVKVDHPAFNTKIFRPGKAGKPGVLVDVGLRVHPDLQDPLKVIFGKRMNNKFTRNWERVDAILKKTALSVSLFHHGALLETGVAKMSPLKVAKMLFTETAKQGVQDKYSDNPLIQYPEETQDALKHGVQFGHSLDINVRGIEKMLESLETSLKGVPVAGKAATWLKTFNTKWDSLLWDYIHDPLKLYAFIDAKAKMPAGVNETVYLREQAQLINDTFGGQNWDVLMVNPQTQQMMRWALLSPDWTTSTVRQALSVTGFGAKSKTGKAIRAKAGAKFWVKAGIYFGIGMNLLNMYYRKKDEEENPEYYPDKMSTWDYTMFSNTLGHKTHLFTGRYEDGSETYMRWGKQFRELPELFMDDEGISFPKPLLKKLGGKAAPLLQTTVKLFTGKSLSNFEDWNLKDKQGWDYSIGIMRTLGQSMLPFSSQSYFRDDKEWYPMDLAMPSSKGMSKSKGIALFRKAIINADEAAVKEIYTGAIRNGLDAYGLFKVAIASVKAEGTKELLKDVKNLDQAKELLQKTTNSEEVKKIKRKISRLEQESQSRKEGFDRLDEALEKMDLFGEPKESGRQPVNNRSKTERSSSTNREPAKRR